MSQENVELSHRVYDAVNRHDLGALLTLMDADVEAVSLLVAMEGGYHGHDGIRRWWGNMLDVFPDWAVEVVEVRDLGDLTLTTAVNHGHGASSDAPLVQRRRRSRKRSCCSRRSATARRSRLPPEPRLPAAVLPWSGPA
jgi:ketosteroid isomerase-like protein